MCKKRNWCKESDLNLWTGWLVKDFLCQSQRVNTGRDADISKWADTNTRTQRSQIIRETWQKMNKAPISDLKEMENDELSDKVFRIILLKKFSELKQNTDFFLRLWLWNLTGFKSWLDSCVTLGKSLSLSDLQFPHLLNRKNYTILAS